MNHTAGVGTRVFHACVSLSELILALLTEQQVAARPRLVQRIREEETKNTSFNSAEANLQYHTLPEAAVLSKLAEKFPMEPSVEPDGSMMTEAGSVCDRSNRWASLAC